MTWIRAPKQKARKTFLQRGKNCATEKDDEINARIGSHHNRSFIVRQDRTNHMEAVDVYLEKIAAETIAKWLAKTAPL